MAPLQILKKITIPTSQDRIGDMSVGCYDIMPSFAALHPRNRRYFVWFVKFWDVRNLLHVVGPTSFDSGTTRQPRSVSLSSLISPTPEWPAGLLLLLLSLTFTDHRFRCCRWNTFGRLPAAIKRNKGNSLLGYSQTLVNFERESACGAGELCRVPAENVCWRHDNKVVLSQSLEKQKNNICGFERLNMSLPLD